MLPYVAWQRGNIVSMMNARLQDRGPWGQKTSRLSTVEISYPPIHARRTKADLSEPVNAYNS